MLDVGELDEISTYPKPLGTLDAQLQGLRTLSEGHRQVPST